MPNRTDHENAERDRDADRLAALMLGYCRGERTAFDALYAQVAPMVFADLLARSGDRRRAEDLLDRTFQTLHQQRSAYVEAADPRPWITELARRELRVDDRRRSGEGQRALWSRLRTTFTRSAPVELEAR